METIKVEDLRVWHAFMEVARQKNFSKASVVLGVPLPQVSKRISKLESILGVRLFHRTTRSVVLTDEGKALLPKVERSVSDLLETEGMFQKKLEHVGLLRITAVPFVAHRLLLPVLKEFLIKYPGIKIQLDLSEKMQNLVEDEYDIALRIETPKDTNLVYRKLLPNNLLLCASPTYLKKSKKINKPEDLHQHQLLSLGIHSRCRFEKSALRISDFSKSRILDCENGAFLTDMALAGMGVLLRAHLDVRDYLASGKLVQVLEKHPIETFGHIYAVIPTRRYVAPRVRVFLDFILESIKRDFQ